LTGIPCFFELARVGDGGFDVGEKILLVALGCGRLPGILEITARHPFVVFGTMDGKILPDLSAKISGATISSFPVYFYETG
jgi:hypothetical protein